MPDKYSFIMIVFEGRWDKTEILSLDEIIKNPILYLGFTSDALLFHGRWVIVGNISTNLSSVIIPYYKVGLPPESQKLINYKVEVIRTATPEEIRLLDNHHSRSPIGYQNMLQAHYGIGQAEEEQKYNYKYIVDTMIKLNLVMYQSGS